MHLKTNHCLDISGNCWVQPPAGREVLYFESDFEPVSIIIRHVISDSLMDAFQSF